MIVVPGTSAAPASTGATMKIAEAVRIVGAIDPVRVLRPIQIERGLFFRRRDPAWCRLAGLTGWNGRRVAMTRLVLSLVVLLALPAASLACSCAEPPPPSEALKAATSVLTGHVVAAIPDGANAFIYTVRVHAVWKGEASPELEIKTSDVAMCGLWMEPGTPYLVYAYGPEQDLSTHNCTRSRPVEFAAADLAELGDPIAVGNEEKGFSMLKARYEQD